MGTVNRGSMTNFEWTAAAKGAVMEGTINLRQEFGLASGAALPESVWLACAQYGTANGAASRNAASNAPRAWVVDIMCPP